MSDATPLFLYTGVTCERFQIYGSCPHCNDWLNNNVRGETRHWETLRKILGATPSGPLGLELFSISNWSFTSCSVINNSGQILSRAKSSFGRFGSFSIFEISAKYLLKISHFSEGWIIILPSCFIGDEILLHLFSLQTELAILHNLFYHKSIFLVH